MCSLRPVSTDHLQSNKHQAICLGLAEYQFRCCPLCNTGRRAPCNFTTKECGGFDSMIVGKDSLITMFVFKIADVITPFGSPSPSLVLCHFRLRFPGSRSRYRNQSRQFGFRKLDFLLRVALL